MLVLNVLLMFSIKFFSEKNFRQLSWLILFFSQSLSSDNVLIFKYKARPELCRWRYLIYCLVNETILEIHVAQLIVMVFDSGSSCRFDIVLISLRSN